MSSELAGRARRRYMVGVQEDRKLFCVRKEGAEVFDGSGLKQKAKKKRQTFAFWNCYIWE